MFINCYSFSLSFNDFRLIFVLLYIMDLLLLGGHLAPKGPARSRDALQRDGAAQLEERLPRRLQGPYGARPDGCANGPALEATRPFHGQGLLWL